MVLAFHLVSAPHIPYSQIGEQVESQLCKVITEPPVLTAIGGGLAGYLGNVYIAFFFFPSLYSQYYKICF